MEVTALKGSSGDVQHFADRIIVERGVRYGRVAMIPTSAKTKRRPNAHLTSETPVVACPLMGWSGRAPAQPAPTNKLQPASLFGEASLSIPNHRALPRLSSVTESIALPPRPKGGRYVQYPQIQCSRVVRTAGIAADLFCAADRRRDAHSMVVHLGGQAQPAHANSSFAPTKRTRPSLAKELDARAVAALDEVRGIPPGDQRTEAMNKAMILRNAAEMHEHFFSKSGAPAQ
ncbi:NikR C terminal nickel binding domain-containing protein [Bradyrhizobium erythrophlei]|jgi:hypothetical protein|nr:NikR C terminal nickel binding domain-containing protein [Bradyrhizobium erythrophlei]